MAAAMYASGRCPDRFGLNGSDSLFMAARDAVSGLEYLYNGRDLAEKGLHFNLHAYQCHVFLDWRELHDDAAHPWSKLCYELAGRGVSSLDDALRGLQLKPLHDAMRDLLAPALIEQFAPAPAAKKKTAKKEEPPTDGNKATPELTAKVKVLLERSRHLAETDRKRAASNAPDPWSGNIAQAITGFERRITTALRLPELESYFSTPWPDEAHEVLPSSSADHKDSARILAGIVAWAAMVAVGDYADPSDPDCSAARILDQQRLREPIAESLAKLGLDGDERWRSAARIRALLAHKPWAPGDDTKKPRAPFSWLQDPDVAWLIGVHSYQEVRYFGKEPYEQLLWWMALPALLRIAATPKVDRASVEFLEEQIQARTRAAADAEYQVDGLFTVAQPVKQKTHS